MGAPASNIFRSIVDSARDAVLVLSDQGAVIHANRQFAALWRIEGDLSDPQRKETLALWRQAAADLRILELRPTRIRTYKD